MKEFFKNSLRGYPIGLFAGLLTVFGCATTFPWRYYGVQMPDSCYDQGRLLGKAGKNGWSDLTLDQCKPDPDPVTPPKPGDPKPVKLKCMTILVDEFYSLKADDEKCHSALDSCQRGPKPTVSSNENTIDQSIVSPLRPGAKAL